MILRLSSPLTALTLPPQSLSQNLPTPPPPPTLPTPPKKKQQQQKQKTKIPELTGLQDVLQHLVQVVMVAPDVSRGSVGQQTKRFRRQHPFLGHLPQIGVDQGAGPLRLRVVGLGLQHDVVQHGGGDETQVFPRQARQLVGGHLDQESPAGAASGRGDPQHLDR